ncbi:up-regulator of cell proliferation-like [Megalops cyprinoides]|uniref:up-regulator of cell proliferation-like n=1 Tax=Megalops cyprinoides TaxID=118141 RepID=UPI0018650AB3|nr:up-regulator of cell proliferation-like [Megalops cyprinoides]
MDFERYGRNLEELLSDLGLKDLFKMKLTLSKALEIGDRSASEEPALSLEALPGYVLNRLMMVNVTARSVKYTPSDHEAPAAGPDSDWGNLVKDLDNRNAINPLDIITAILLCSDNFLQQELVVKMSMCQFAVPLLLPHCDKQKCTLMLWAMRGVVKKFRPHSLAYPKASTENNIALTNLPMVSFIRLGEISMSKSQILNKLLSNPQQYHDTFVHRDMECGDRPRRISNGLVEITWYLPCGNKNIDVFSEPMAVANCRGDVRSFETQYSFLCHTSAAIFVFFDNLKLDLKYWTVKNVKAQLFLIINSQGKTISPDTLQKVAADCNIERSNIIMKTNQNDADFVRKLSSTVREVIEKSPQKMSVKDLYGVALELGIQVDENCNECLRAEKRADELTGNIENTLKFKEDQLPLQGEIWKELSQIEKERCRLKQAGNQEIEHYKSSLERKEKELRERQCGFTMTKAMDCFIAGMASSRIERSYFLKWMRINLDNLSCKSLSDLREKYREHCQKSVRNKQMIADLDRQISNSSLGIEHFLREMGQLYESSCSLPENSSTRKRLEKLPRLCAQMLLDGFPLELVDGDASNIPIKWVSKVLSELHSHVNCNSKIRVVTVLGVQSTGKSTLLNTMFGVQFAVSSGRCTRGAFMLLIGVKEDFREQLGCDFLMVIDTEGLKSPELAQLTDSYEHDNELATLVVGLSDITIINIAMENSAEMKDILQIVVHTFLRMKEVGKKPCCQFVHQNVADVSAHDNNLRDRQLLLEQLDEVTQVAARMEKKEETMTFTDVMDYDPERNTWYIPGLWHGNPPMAAVSAGYSEAVNEFKSRMVDTLEELKGTRPAHTIPELLEWTKSLWKAVKYENFIFSFQNSLAADAYTKLCTEFNKWEWEFRKHMYTWVSGAETSVSNFCTAALAAQKAFSLDDLLSVLENEVSRELDKGEKQITESLTKYYQRKEDHMYLVEKYREDFMNSVKSLKRELQTTLIMKLETAMNIKKGMAIVESIKKKHKAIMEGQVQKLVKLCRTSQTPILDQQLEQEFEKMWTKTTKMLSFKGLKRLNIVQEVYNLLKSNLETKGGSVHEMLSQITHLDRCGKEQFIVSNDDKKYAVRCPQSAFMHEWIQKIQEMSDCIIQLSSQFTEDKLETRTDFQKTYIVELLRMIDEHLEAHRNLQFTAHIEASLKIHICGHAARKFQQMHDAFIRDNDPQQCLQKFKQQYYTDFKDLFYKRDLCHRKAQEFSTQCLKPAVREYVSKALGPDIVDEMITGNKAIDFSTRSFFQFSILKKLLAEDKFENFAGYIMNYENFVKKWIFNWIVGALSKSNRIAVMENYYLKKIIRNIKEAVMSAKVAVRSEEEMSIHQFIKDICGKLSETLAIPKDDLDAVMVLNHAKTEQFFDWLLSSIDEMEASLSTEFHSHKDVRTRLTTMPFKPQDELFNRVIGCGKQCPFCFAPCEAGGKGHTEHFTSIHRPEGLRQYKWKRSRKLVPDICSSLVASEITFRSAETNGKFHPYKDYQKFYPDWRIQPDTSIQASAYWKYVFAKFNTQFAKEYDAQPADLPPKWKSITKEQAMKSLEEAFMMKKRKNW